MIALAPLAPLLLLLACLWDGPRRRVASLLWLGPLPGLLVACLAGGAPPLVLYADGLRFGLALEASTAPLLAACALLWSLAGGFAGATLGRRPGGGRFALWWLATLAGSMGVFVAQDLLGFYLAFALVSLAPYALIVHDGTARARRAGEVTLLLAVVGEVCLLLAFALMADAVPGPSLAIADAVAAMAQSPARNLVMGLLLAGFGLKAGLLPLHVWLPLAHPAAPSPASAVLSGAIVKAGLVGLLRFLPLEGAADWGLVLAVLGGATAFWGVGCGIVQANLKAVLAYSTVSQMGVMAAALGMGMVLAVPATPLAVCFYALHHALAKGALFLAVGVAPSVGRGRWALLLGPALVLALGFGGMPGTGGALAKAAVKPQLGEGVAGLLAALSAAGSTLLMLHFARRLAAIPGTGRPPGAVLLPWLALALAAVLLPWALHRPLGLGDPWAVLAKDPAATLGPVLLGAALAAALGRWGARLPRVPGGDILHLARGGAGAMGAAGGVLARVEAVLRGWAAAALCLLALVLALLAAMLGA